MTDHDKPLFAQTMTALATALREPAHDAAQLRTYFDGLKDLDVELVADAASKLASEAQFFPKISEWRARVFQVERDRSEQQRQYLQAAHKAGVVLCESCDDTGWMRNTEQRVQPCSCRKLRRLELLGRRPLPLALPEAR